MTSLITDDMVEAAARAALEAHPNPAPNEWQVYDWNEMEKWD